MKVIVEYLLRFREIVGKESEVLSLDKEVTIGQLLRILQERYGEQFKEEFYNPSGDQVGGNILILLNGKTVTNLNIRLKDGDRVTLTYVAFGG